MFELLSYYELQVYWWIIISLLAGLLSFMMFVQGGQTLIDSLASNETEKSMLVNSLGRKWELGFTTLVLLGGALFAAFPKFYSTSFGGAYWVWLAILFTFIIQAVSYEYRTKAQNFLGQKTYEIFLKINGYGAPFLLGAAISTMFTGSSFSFTHMNFVVWYSEFRGLEALFCAKNYVLAFTLVFMTRMLGAMYFASNIEDEEIKNKALRSSLINGLIFVVLFLVFLAVIFLGNAYRDEAWLAYGHFLNFWQNPLVLVVFLLGVVLVLLGLALAFFKSKRAIFASGVGVVLAVMCLFLIIGINKASFYPSLSNIASSLTIENASSSEYTLVVMAYVSLLVPFVLGYIIYVWYLMDKKGITKEEMSSNDFKY